MCVHVCALAFFLFSVSVGYMRVPICLCACLHVCLSLYLSLCVCVYMYVCVCVCVRVCVYIYIYIYIYTNIYSINIYIYIYLIFKLFANRSHAGPVRALVEGGANVLHPDQLGRNAYDRAYIIRDKVHVCMRSRSAGNGALPQQFDQKTDMPNIAILIILEGRKTAFF